MKRGISTATICLLPARPAPAEEKDGKEKPEIAAEPMSSATEHSIRMEYFEAGRMMYLHEASMQKCREDLAGFIRDTDRR